jgi:hypothetical protein
MSYKENMKLRIKIVLSCIVGVLVGSCIFPEYTADLNLNAPDKLDASIDVVDEKENSTIDSGQIFDATTIECINQKFCNNKCEDYSINNGCFSLDCSPCYQGANMQTLCDPNIIGCAYKCNVNFDDCDMNSANGCETDLSNTDEHCASCDNDCHNGEWHMNCVNYKCQCGGAWNDCNNDPSDGCEQDFWADANCGACNTPCPAGKHCQFGTCIF